MSETSTRPQPEQPATTEHTRQLPGVKGQWILCSECPPTEADADCDGHVQAESPDLVGWRYVHWSKVRADRYWRPEFDNFVADDPRPFTLPATPTPPQPAAGARKFDKLTGNPDGSILWAVADDGTAWERNITRFNRWLKLPSLPDREVG